MLSSPITITIGATPFTLNRINQDNFGATYLAKGTNVEVRLDIRHQYEKATVSGQFERHNCDLKFTTFDPTGAVPPRVVQSYTVIRGLRGSTATFVADVAQALASFVSTNADAVVDWES